MFVYACSVYASVMWELEWGCFFATVPSWWGIVMLQDSHVIMGNIRPRHSEGIQINNFLMAIFCKLHLLSFVVTKYFIHSPRKKKKTIKKLNIYKYFVWFLHLKMYSFVASVSLLWPSSVFPSHIRSPLEWSDCSESVTMAPSSVSL